MDNDFSYNQLAAVVGQVTHPVRLTWKLSSGVPGNMGLPGTVPSSHPESNVNGAARAILSANSARKAHIPFQTARARSKYSLCDADQFSTPRSSAPCLHPGPVDP